MKSPIIKLAAAAVIIAAGLFFFTQPGSVALAEVAEKVGQYDSLLQLERRFISVVGYDEPAFITDVKKYVSTDYGSVEKQYDLQGNLLSTVYILKGKQQFISLIHQNKTYFIINLKDTPLELPDFASAKALVECIVLEQHPTKLGRKEIDGRKAEGFEAVNPEAIKEVSRISNGLLPIGDSTWRLWIDVETKLPIKIEGEFIFEEGPLTNFIRTRVKTVTTSLVWGAEIDDSIFELVIPDDYTLVDASNFTQ